MKTKIFAIFILTLLVLSACGPQKTLQVKFAPGSQAWIDAPLPGSSLPLAPVEIVAHAASPDGIASFEISLNGQLLTKTAPDPASLDQTLMYMRHTWRPAAPGSYLIEVKAFDQKNQPGPSAQVVVEVGGPTPTASLTEIPTPTFTLTPALTLTLTLTLTPTLEPPTFTLTVDAYCWVGPDIRYAKVNTYPAGQSFLILGRNAEDSWFFVRLMQNMNCWFDKSVGTTRGDLSHLQIFYGPPLPTNTPFRPTRTPTPACSSHKDKASCNADTACVWAVTLAGPGVCKAK